MSRPTSCRLFFSLLLVIPLSVLAVELPTTTETRVVPADRVENDDFGAAVSLDGDTLLVGDDGDAGFAGAAYIFSRNQDGIDNWGQVAKLTASDAVAMAGFGYSVAISGDTAVVGAPWDFDYSGSVYVFYRDQDGPDAWGQVKKLRAFDADIGDYFGVSVAISGDTILVGSMFDSDDGSGSGSAYIFSRDQDGPDAWGLVKKLTASDAATGDQFGVSVSIHQDTALVGAWYEDGGALSTGSAYVFGRNQGDIDNWGQVAKLTASDGALGDYFGFSVSVNGDIAVVGAYGDDDGESKAGSAYIFSRNQDAPDHWGQVTKLTAPVAAVNDQFGRSVSVSGDAVLVGAIGYDEGGDTGMAHVFRRDEGGLDSWGHVLALEASDIEVYEAFAWAVAIDGYTAVSSALYGDTDAPDSGTAYVYDIYLFDTDNDGMPDKWEDDNGLDSADNSDAVGDLDSDDLSNLNEYLQGTNPNDNDTDDDGMPDGWEINYGLSPLDASDAAGHADSDALNNLAEYTHGTSPTDSDSDDDGFDDAWEVANNFNPLVTTSGTDDADGDLLTNAEEYAAQTDPNDDTSPGNTFYVDALSGDDTEGLGSEASPWASVTYAMTRVTLYATEPHPVTILVAEGTYDGRVDFAPHVRLVGAGSGNTVLRHYNAADNEHYVIAAALDTALSGCTVTLAQTVDQPISLVRIEQVDMLLSDVLLDGLDSIYSTGAFVTGVASSASNIADCVIRRLNYGVFASDTGANITRNRFEDILSDALFVRRPTTKAGVGLAPVMGNASNPESGFNSFSGIYGDCIKNMNDTAEVAAEMNDWGVYTEAEIQQKVGGTVDFIPYVGAGLVPGTLVASVLDNDSRIPVSADYNPSVQIEELESFMTYEEASGVFLSAGLPADTYTLLAQANAYTSASTTATVEAGKIQVVGIYLVNTGATEGEGEGEGQPEPTLRERCDVNGDGVGTPVIDAVDVQLVINHVLQLANQFDCDIDNDGYTNAVDVQLVINAALGLL